MSEEKIFYVDSHNNCKKAMISNEDLSLFVKREEPEMNINNNIHNYYNNNNFFLYFYANLA